MKKIILMMAVVLTATFANAQKDMKFGVKGGFTSSNLAGDTATSSTTGFYVGGLVDFTVSEKFHVQPELLYSMEGAKDNKLNYVRIPIMAKYYIMEGLNLQAGPEVAFKAGGDTAATDVTKSLDYGLGIGAGYELTNGLMFDARYNLGLANIYDGPVAKVNTVSINLGLGYRF